MPGEPAIICIPRMEFEFVVFMHVLFAAALAVYLLVCWRDKRLRAARPCLILQAAFLVGAYWNFYALLMTQDVIGFENMFHFGLMGFFGILSLAMCIAALKCLGASPQKPET